MKSSTLRRSNLSKERMAVLEQLAEARRKPTSAVEEYTRQEPTSNKEKELDVLWQNFRVNQKDEKTPGIYLATGFIAGAIVMLIITTLLSFSVNGNSEPQDLDVQPTKEKAKLNFIPADKAAPEATIATEQRTYTVKQGDTLAGIIVRFYGSYDISKIDSVLKANNLKNADSIKIGQNLIMPME